MKYVITLFVIGTFLTKGFSQIEKTEKPEWRLYSEVKSLSSPVASIKYMVEGKDTTYAIFFENLKYTHISDVQSIMFFEDGGVLNSLYQILSETLNSENGKKNTFKLGKKEVIATCVKVIGSKSVNITLVENGAYFGLTRKQLDKLFNKKA